MGILGLSRFWALLLLGYLGAEVTASIPSAGGSDRVLRAATRRSDLFRRDVRIRRSFEANLAYIESENGFQSHSIFASNVRVKSEVPILSLEDIEHHLSDIQCSGSSIKLDFVSGVSARDAYNACKHEKGGYIISSHHGCNDEGDRGVFKIYDMGFSEETASLHLSVEEVAWKNAFSKIDVDFGHTTDGHLLRRHSQFQRREDDVTTSTSGSAASSTITPAPIPTSVDPDVTSATFDIAFSTIDSTFPVPIPIGIAGNPDLVALEIGCKNCTTSGCFLLTQGAFSLDTDKIDIVPEFIDGEEGTAFDIITGGFVEIQANAVAAHIELRSIPAISAEFEFPLFPALPIVGFSIPGLGRAGVFFEPVLHTAYSIKGGLEFTYGFQATVPNGSKLRIDLGNMTNSDVFGFDQTIITPLPFTANITDVEMTLKTGFRPKFPIGFSFFDDKLTAEVNAFIDLPQLEARITTLKEPVDAGCNEALAGNSTTNTTTPLPTATPTPTNLPPTLLSSLCPLLHIAPSVNLAIGIGAEFEADGPLPAFSTDITVLETKFPLPTACLAINAGFTPATAAYAKVTEGFVKSREAEASRTRGAGDAVVPNGGATGTGAPVGKGGAEGAGVRGSGEAWMFVVVGLGVVGGGMVML